MTNRNNDEKTGPNSEAAFWNAIFRELRSDAFQEKRPDPGEKSCPNDDELFRFSAGALGEEEMGKIRRRLLFCPDCMEAVFSIKSLVEKEGARHPPNEELYDYVLGWLDPGRAAEIEEHLASCAICESEARRIQWIEKQAETAAKEDNVSAEQSALSFVSSESIREKMVDPLIEWISRVVWIPKTAIVSRTANPGGGEIDGGEVFSTSDDAAARDGRSGLGRIECDFDKEKIKIDWEINRENFMLDLWVRFVDPATGEKLFETNLGNQARGTVVNTIGTKHLGTGFDPFQDRWGILFFIKKPEEKK